MSNIVNLTTPSIDLKIAGADCSNLLETAKLSYNTYVPGSGLIISLGEFVLSHSIDFAESLDPKRNRRWAHGRKIELKLDGEWAPIAGIQYIESSSWDGEKLSITTSCKLSMLNYATPGSLGICLRIEDNVTLGNALIKLLISAGIPSSDIDMSLLVSANIGLLEPKNIGEGQSIIGFASQLASANGYVLFQNNAGKIEVADITSIQTKPSAFNLPRYKLADYGRQITGELPPGKVIINGSVGDKYFTDTFKTSQITSGVQDLLQNTQINFANRTITTAANTLVSGITIQSSKEINYYEGKSNGAAIVQQASSGNGLRPDKDCIEKDDARLYKKIVRNKAQASIAIKPWIEVSIAAGITNTTFTSGTILYELITNSYDYNLPELETIELGNNTVPTAPGFGSATLSASASSQNFVQHNKEVQRAIGLEMPIFAKYSAVFPLNPYNLILAEKEVHRWVLDTNLQQWTRTSTYYRTVYSQSPEQIQAQASRGSLNIATAYSSGRQLRLIKTEVIEGSSPPDFGRMPAKAYVQYTPFKATYTLNKDLAKTNEYSVGDLIGTAGDALPIAETYAKWQFGKINAHTIVLPTNKILGQAHRFVPAINTCTVYEPLYDTVYHYAIDTPTLIIQNTESVISLTGVYLGSQGRHAISPTSLIASELPTTVDGSGDLPLDPTTVLDPQPLTGPEATFNGDLRPNSNGDLTIDGSDLNLNELIDGDSFPNIGEENPRFSSNNANLNGQGTPPGTGNFSAGASLGGFNWRRPPLPEYPNLEANNTADGFEPSQQANLNQSVDGSLGGGGGGDPQFGGGSLVLPSGQASIQPLQIFGQTSNGRRPGGVGGGSGGGGLGAAGGGGGGAAGGAFGGYIAGTTSAEILQYMFFGWFLDFPQFRLGLGSELILEDSLTDTNSYFDTKKPPSIIIQ